MLNSKAPSLAAVWTSLQDEYRSHLEKLQLEMVSSWGSLEEATNQVQGAFDSAAANRWEADRIASLESYFGKEAQSLLLEPLRVRLQAKPQHRVIRALERFGTAVEDMMRQLPTTLAVSGQDLVNTLGSDADGSLRPNW